MRLSLCLLLIPWSLAIAADLPVVSRNRIPIANDKPVPAGAGIEFFITDDGGQTWRLVPRDEYRTTADGRPSFLFRAPQDGAYGIWIRLTGLQGRSEPAPRPGDPPELAFIVDTTPPAFSTFTAVIRRSSAGAQLLVDWEANDANPGDGPVRIELAPLQGGAWQTLSTGLPLSGEHRARSSSERLRVRLAAEDAAGNTATTPATVPAILVASDQDTAGTSQPTDPLSMTSGGPARPTTPTPAAGELPSLAEVEAAVDRQLAATGEAGQPTANPEASVPTVPEATGPDLQERLAALPLLAVRAWPAPSPTASEEAALIAATTSILKQRTGRLLLDRQARVVLDAARAVARAGDIDQARDWYRRLHDSQLAAEALPEQVLLELRSGHPLRARALAEEAPPEARTPALDLARAYAWFAEDPARSLAILQTLNPQSPVAPEADLLQARALLAIDLANRPTALVLLRRLARRPGAIGDTAQDLVDLIGP